MLENFSLEAQKIISSAESLSFDLSNKAIGCEHLLLALLKIPDNTLTLLLKKYRVNFKNVVNIIKDNSVATDSEMFIMEYNKEFKSVLERAQMLCKEWKEEKVSINDIIISFLEHPGQMCSEVFISNNVDVNYLLTYFIKCQKRQHSDLERIIDLHDLSSIKKDPLIGRKKELQQLILALRRRNKPNAILIGLPGVGKTAIVEELAKLISQNKVKGLENKRIYELDVSSVVGGTKYRGEFEDKLKKIIKCVKEDGNAILFIDEIHNIIKAGGAEGAIDASNILKPYLSRGDIQVIGATTIEEYNNIFLKDKALNRRFQTIIVEASNKDETKEILKNLKKIYEEHYNLSIDEDVTNYIVEIADEHIPNQSFPDKAIDILDNSCVIAEIKLTKEDVNKMVERFYGIQNKKENKSHEIVNKLKKEIIGQEKAIEQIYQGIKLKECGFINEEGPKMSMFFVGPSGVGKSLSAKIIAKCMTNNKDGIIKLNMAYYQNYNAINKLIGTYSGYKDNENTTHFVQTIKTYPSATIIIDQIDKAHHEVLDIFDNILEEGMFFDCNNNKINCRGLTLIFISNNIDNYAILEDNFKLTPKDSDIHRQEEWENKAKTPFLSKVDFVVNFRNITEKDIKEIVEKYSLKHSISDEATSNIYNELSQNRKKLSLYGVRFVRNVIYKQAYKANLEKNTV